MANTKALHSFVSLPGNFTPSRSYAPTWGRLSVMHEHGYSESSASSLTPSSVQALSRLKQTPTTDGSHAGLSKQYEMIPHDRRHRKKLTLNQLMRYRRYKF